MQAKWQGAAALGVVAPAGPAGACGGCQPLVMAQVLGDGFWPTLLALGLPALVLVALACAVARSGR